MSSYYLDLEASGTGHAGTALDPFSVSDWQTFVASESSDNTYYVKGTLDTSATLVWKGSAPTGNIYTVWDAVANGPWRVRVTTSQTFNGNTFSGGILYSDTDGGAVSLILDITFLNMYVLIDGNIRPTGTIKGSLFWALNTLTLDVSTWTDCAIRAGVVGGGDAYLYNCAFRYDVAIGSFIPTDCQYGNSGILPSSLPAWDAAQALFAIEDLYTSVTTPPEPGNPPYTGYNSYLWGGMRLGIGTGYSYMGYPPTWADSYPCTCMIGPYNVMMVVQTDLNGNAYFVVLPDGATAPSSAQVKAGQDSTGSSVASGHSGSVALTANTPASFIATNLTAETDYDIYFVAENAFSFLQLAPVKLDVTTGCTPIFPPEDENSNNFIGMPPQKLGVAFGGLSPDANRGNPLGDVVDNTAGENEADGTEDNKPVRAVGRGGGGGIISISSRPSWLMW